MADASVETVAWVPGEMGKIALGRPYLWHYGAVIRRSYQVPGVGTFLTYCTSWMETHGCIAKKVS
jgi:hypothetical protein